MELMDSSSSSSSSPSIGLGSNERNDFISLANEDIDVLLNGDVVQAITKLTNIIDSNIFLNKNNNNFNNNKNFNINNNNNKTNSNENNDLNSNGKELSKLYAIRAQFYLKLNLHQLAFDDSNTGLKCDYSNENCFYLKGRALLGLNQREAAEQAFQMALELRKDFTEASQELIKIRFEALKEAGFDEETANRFAPKSRSVNEAIDAILSRSLTSSELSDLRASYTRSLSNTNQFSTQAIDSQSLMSGIFGNKNLNKNIIELSSGSKVNTCASESLGLKLISDIDNCLGNILDSDEEKKPTIYNEKYDNKSATNANNANNFFNNNNNNNNICDIKENNFISTHSFGITSSNDLMKQKPNSFTLDLNKDTLGSHIMPKHTVPPKKTFADIASANTKKPVKSLKLMANMNLKTITNGKIEKIDTKDMVSSRPIKVLDSCNKVSSLESFSIPNNIDEKIEKNGSNILTDIDSSKPTNLMAYKGLWVCNISPDASFMTLKKVFRKYGNFTGIQTFERKATNGSNIVFVHYDNSQSPTDAIAELFGIYRKDICFDELTPLKLRFTPSMEQTKTGDLPSMEKAKRVVEKSGECFNWRLSTGCHKGDRCAFKHILINKAIDSQPWVKALKKKATET